MQRHRQSAAANAHLFLMAGRIITDTSNFFSIEPGDILLVEGHRYLVKGEAREMRFGIEDPKFWVKKAIDCRTQEHKIIKLPYTESFMTDLGGVKIHCFRHAEKESQILNLVNAHPSFMHGNTLTDAGGNPVRVLDIVRGANFLFHIDQFRMPHEKYFHTELPAVLRKLIEAFQAISFLHSRGFKHGDIRNDHVIVEYDSGRYVWIDFDYDFELSENPFSLDIFGLGNLLVYAVGKGFHRYYTICNDAYVYKDLAERLKAEDFSILHKARLVNLRKFYPYIPPMLNNILMHFARGTHLFYDSVDEIIEDLKGYLASI